VKWRKVLRLQKVKKEEGREVSSRGLTERGQSISISIERSRYSVRGIEPLGRE
jgi:hypothetical protein